MQHSIWMKQTNKTIFSKPPKEIHSDIIIVGAGLCGISLAYYLSQSDLPFVVVEANEVGQGASGRNTGKVTSQHALIYQYLINTFSKKEAKAYYEANEEAIHSIEVIIEDCQIQCDFQHVSSLVYAQLQEDVVAIEKEIEAYSALHIPHTEALQSKFDVPFIKGVRLKNQAQYDPYAYCMGLATYLQQQGCTIYEHTPIRDIQKETHRYILQSDDCLIYAKKIVLATQFPFLDQKQLYFTKLFHEQSIIEVLPNEKEYWEQLVCCGKETLSYRSLVQKQQYYLLKGSEHHPVGRNIPVTKKSVMQWSSQDYTTADRLPLIGELVQGDPTILFASGFQKWGNTMSNVAAKLLCSLLVESPSPYQSMFDPHRKGLLMNPTSIKENTKTALAYLQSKVQPTTNLYPQRGCATLIEWDNITYGVYKDEKEQVFIVNTKCPHLGCQCVFNEVDKTWDCPCHGSRFSYTGEVIKGPTTHPLGKFDQSISIDPHLFMKYKKKP